MNRNQWFTLSIFFGIIAIFFMNLDLKYSCFEYSDIDSSLDKYDIYCIINGEMYEPFIYSFVGLAIVFLICGFLEHKKKH